MVQKYNTHTYSDLRATRIHHLKLSISFHASKIPRRRQPSLIAGDSHVHNRAHTTVEPANGIDQNAAESEKSKHRECSEWLNISRQQGA